jgi:hypothetical protein
VLTLVLLPQHSGERIVFQNEVMKQSGAGVCKNESHQNKRKSVMREDGCLLHDEIGLEQ